MEWIYEENRIWISSETGECLAEVTFPAQDERTVNLNHTFVDEQLRGQGLAEKLLSEAANYLRKKHMRVIPTCSYAVNWFHKHPEYRYLL